MKNDVFAAGNFQVKGLNFAMAYSELNKHLKNNQPIDDLMSGIRNMGRGIYNEVIEKAAKDHAGNEFLKPYLSQSVN